jgi:hypothetical protein
MGSMVAFDPSQLDSTEVPAEMRAMLAGMGGFSAFAPMMRQLGGAMLGGQIGTAIGELAGDMASSTDIGLPLAAEGTAALLPSGVTAFGEGLSVDIGEVRLFLALREAAHHRLFGHVPWLRQHLLGAVEAYAAGITVDVNKLRDTLPELDMTNPSCPPPPSRGSCMPPPWRRRSAAAAPPAAPRSAPSPPSSALSSVPGCCEKRRRCGPRCRGHAASTAGTRCGRTRTCCRRPTIWRTRTRS